MFQEFSYSVGCRLGIFKAIVIKICKVPSTEHLHYTSYNPIAHIHKQTKETIELHAPNYIVYCKMLK